MSVRNFAIIAHIDHGKTTLCDRLIQSCGALSARQMRAQVLDSMDIERERGITVKAQTARLTYVDPAGQAHTLNLIDTPGHVDFTYEVSRSLSACEGSLLVVDAAQGVEAQTLSTVYQALEAGHEIIPVLNKIDLPAARPEVVRRQIAELVGLDTTHLVEVSAKTSAGIPALLEAVVAHLPSPRGDPQAPLKALLVDSWYDAYLGVVALVRIFDGTLRAGETIRLMSTGAEYTTEEVGIFSPQREKGDALTCGDIGYITAGIKAVAEARVGETLTHPHRPCSAPLGGFKRISPVVFCGFFPVDAGRFEELREAAERLRLNDASFFFEVETSAALGAGLRCGFLGLLHLEVIRERLSREFALELITTAPGVVYHAYFADGARREIHNPCDLPCNKTSQKTSALTHLEEPWVEATLFVPASHVGAVLGLCETKRGVQKSLVVSDGHAKVVYELPLNEVIFDFYDRLKSKSRGYASFDYQFVDYRTGDLVRLDLLVNGVPVDALAMIVPRHRAEARGRTLCRRLKESIPQHLFKVPIQAALNGRVVARETIPALRKDVTAKLYGGDHTRKRKLLDKQKKGKKRLRQFGEVTIPQEAFVAALRLEET